jgi:putative toxin-antitoxin system antitoxin component (TIGR02293 family)
VARKHVRQRDEMARLARIAKTIGLAERVFGDRASALEWLETPKTKFGGSSPFELLATGDGGALIDEEIISIDEGYVA